MLCAKSKTLKMVAHLPSRRGDDLAGFQVGEICFMESVSDHGRAIMFSAAHRQPEDNGSRPSSSNGRGQDGSPMT
jgi:hypothetical protein